jgi:hypothetical protein
MLRMPAKAPISKFSRSILGSLISRLDLGVDHLSGPLRRWRRRLIATEPEQVLRGRATRKRQLRRQDQKKNAKPTFHSSTSSLSFLLVKTT